LIYDQIIYKFEPHPTLPGREGYKINKVKKAKSPYRGDLEGLVIRL